MSQVDQLNKERDGLLKNYEAIKKNYERDVSQAQQAESYRTESWQKRPLEETRQQIGDDSHKKLAKVQKEYDIANKERNRLKEEIQQKNISINDLNDKIGELKKRTEVAENEKRSAQMSEAKNKKLLEQFIEKNKNDSERTRRQHEDELKRI